MLILLVVVAAGCWLAAHWFNSGTDSGRSLTEVKRSELALVSGRLCLLGHTNAFTGRMLEYAEDGTLRSRSIILQGHLNGCSEGYYTNGQVQVTEYFKDGISDGLRTKWYPNGARMSEVMIIEGKLHGTFRRWHENGQLSEQIQYVADQPQGEATAYFPSGYLKAKATLQGGKLIAQNYFTDGERKE